MSRREDREAAANGPLVTYAFRAWETATYRGAHRAIARIIRREERAQRRCWRHEDCREDHELGAHCYARRRRWPWAASAVCQGACCVGPVGVLRPMDVAALTRVLKSRWPDHTVARTMYETHSFFAMTTPRRGRGGFSR